MRLCVLFDPHSDTALPTIDTSIFAGGCVRLALQSGYIQGLLDGVEFKQTAYALDRDSRKAALARFLRKAAGEPFADAEQEHRLAA